MNTNNRQFIMIMLLLVIRPVFAGDFLRLPDNSLGKVALFTDRSIYICGEQVRFYATLFEGNDSVNTTHSFILNCELITPDGNKIVSDKFSIFQSSASGCITIPKDLLSGVYYIRAYTKIMRNYGPDTYAYKQIRIVNPAKNGIYTRKNNKDSTAIKLVKASFFDPKDRLTVSVNKTAFSSHDTINVTVKAGTGIADQIKGMCLSVVPENSSSPSLSVQPVNISSTAEASYYPETRGLSLTGKLTAVTTGTPVRDKKINLSIIGDGRDFMAVRTDSAGQFFFSLPHYYGSRDLFLCAEKTPGTEVKIWIDNDFCTTPFHLPLPEFSLSEQEREAALNMALNMQINSNFQSDVKPDSVNAKNERTIFYDKPSHIVYLDKYIQLPTLEECFNELPSLARVRQRKGEKYFYMLGSADLTMYDPLVLVDWVAVDEPSKILAVSPQNISRIEFVNEKYVKGGQTYGGIISIISKKGDFAGIDLPSTGIFIKYNFLSEDQCQEMYHNNLPGNPDIRNTLLWEPGLPIQNAISEKFVFTAPHTAGKYSVVLEGVTKSGEVVSVTGMFEVTK